MEYKSILLVRQTTHLIFEAFQSLFTTALLTFTAAKGSEKERIDA